MLFFGNLLGLLLELVGESLPELFVLRKISRNFWPVSVGNSPKCSNFGKRDWFSTFGLDSIPPPRRWMNFGAASVIRLAIGESHGGRLA